MQRSFKSFLAEQSQILFKQNLTFFVPFLLFLLLGFVYLVLSTKGDEIRFVSIHHTIFLDNFFYYATWLGDGLFIAVILLPFALIRIAHTIHIFITYIVSGAIAQLIKKMYPLPRPKLFFESQDFLHYVPGVSIHLHNSFPSGHTATAFAFFLVLTFFIQNKLWGLLFFCIALSVGLSRVYLSLHFFIDIYFGSIIGVVISFFLYICSSYLFERKNSKWQNLSLIDVLFRRRRANV